MPSGPSLKGGLDGLFAKMRRGFGGIAVSRRGLPIAPGVKIGFVATNAIKWEVCAERDASEFGAGYYRKR